VTRDVRFIWFLWAVCLFCSLELFAPERQLGLVALCLLSVYLHQDSIVILCPVSLFVVWDIRIFRVIWGFYLISGFGFLGFFCGYIFVIAFQDGSVFIASVGFDRVRTLQLAFISFALLP
jgi:hypothetical protein